MRFLPFQQAIFSGVVSLDTSFGYSASEAGDLQVLKEAKRVLARNGQLLMDVFNRNRMIHRYGRGFSYLLVLGLWWSLMRFLACFPSLGNLAAGLFKWREYPDFYLLQKRMANAQSGELVDLWLVRAKQSGRLAFFVHVVRLYDLSLLLKMFEKAEFCVKSIYGNYKADAYAEMSSRLIAVVQ